MSAEAWASFFPPEARVVALPSWRRPRLFLTGETRTARWAASALYPAFRLPARLRRLLLRAEAASNLVPTRRAPAGAHALNDFLADTLPAVSVVAVLAGTPGPAQKMTAQLSDSQGRIVGYLKYAETPVARRRLANERRVLRDAPNGVAPPVLKFGPFAKGDALLLGAIDGTPARQTDIAPDAIRRFLNHCVASAPMPLDEHPAIRSLRAADGGELDAWLPALSGRRWPVVLHHGDFAPWNLIERTDGSLAAIDWEYGSPQGFPYLDLAHLVLQTSTLLHRASPATALSRAAHALCRTPWPDLSPVEAEALVKLSAYRAYREQARDGQPAENHLQTWRRNVWGARV